MRLNGWNRKNELKLDYFTGADCESRRLRRNIFVGRNLPIDKAM